MCYLNPSAPNTQDIHTYTMPTSTDKAMAKTQRGSALFLGKQVSVTSPTSHFLYFAHTHTYSPSLCPTTTTTTTTSSSPCFSCYLSSTPLLPPLPEGQYIARAGIGNLLCRHLHPHWRHHRKQAGKWWICYLRRSCLYLPYRPWHLPSNGCRAWSNGGIVPKPGKKRSCKHLHSTVQASSNV